MALSNLFAWNKGGVPASCGSACGRCMNMKQEHSKFQKRWKVA